MFVTENVHSFVGHKKMLDAPHVEQLRKIKEIQILEHILSITYKIIRKIEKPEFVSVKIGLNDQKILDLFFDVKYSDTPIFLQ